MKELFDTQEKINLAVSNFKTLKDHAGWQLLVEIVEANMKVLEDQILNGFENETKDEIDRKRDKLKAYKEIVGTPDFWIDKFKENAPFKEDNDPYFTVESYKKRK
jgi:hypothetical protein